MFKTNNFSSKDSGHSLFIVLVIILIPIFVLFLFSSSIKVIVSSIIFLFLLPIYIWHPRFWKIIVPVVMITFPITLQVFERDAISTGTLMIFISFIWSMSKYKIGITFFKNRTIFVILSILLLISFIGLLSGTPQGYWGPGIRHYVNFLSSVIVFVLIINSKDIKGIAKNSLDYINKVINVILFITVTHIFLCFLIFNFDFFEDIFSIFLRRTQENISLRMRDEVYLRAATIFTGGEELGELLVLLFPFSLYKFFSENRKINFLIILSISFGVILSGTRSAFFLVAFQFILFLIFFIPRDYNIKKLVFFNLIIVSIFITIPFLMQYSHLLFDRMKDTLYLIHADEEMSIVLNRKAVWVPAYSITISSLSLFGHGPIQAFNLGLPISHNFHSLYLTLLFQFGIIGFIFFMIFFGFLIKRLFHMFIITKQNKDNIYLLVTCCILSFIGFLINEIKFEFNRSDSYQQLVWCIFSVYYLSGTLFRNSRVVKRNL